MDNGVFTVLWLIKLLRKAVQQFMCFCWKKGNIYKNQKVRAEALLSLWPNGGKIS